MLFHTATFAIFLASLLILLSLLRGRWLWGLLMLASYVFYGWAQPQYLFLIFATSIVDYWVSNWFVHRPHLRRAGIVVSALGNFGVLAYFKYANFFIENFQSALLAVGIHADPVVLKIVLPIGISFHTFQSFSYIVDVLQGKFPPCKSPVLFLLYVSYFPQLVAGPIERAHQLLPQLERIPQMKAGMAGRVPEAALLFAEGWLRKAFADWMALSANAFFGQTPANAGGAEAAYGIIAFGFQIYGDFSGYTRMAQGISWLFGVRLMENFNAPYAAVSFRDFWTRWHISLSRWFRDYLYIPLGGNHKGRFRGYVNLMITMVVSGLWHGAAWTFLLWGGIHGVFMAVERFGRDLGLRLPNAFSRPVVVILAFLAWVPFRAPSLNATIASYLALGHPGWNWPPLNLVLAFIGLVGCDLLAIRRSAGIERDASALSVEVSNDTVWRAAALVSLCFLTLWFGTMLGHRAATTFIYFQF